VYVSEAMRGRLLERAVHSKPDEVPALVELLSERELKILRLIARGLNTHEIAERLNVTPNAIESHRNRIRKKLQLRNATQVIQYAVQWVEGTSDDGHDSGSYHGPQ
jgi:DNA-binding NarL/FixJ family response regulator